MLPSLEHARTALARTQRARDIAINEAAAAERAARKAWIEVDVLNAAAEALRQQIEFDESVIAASIEPDGNKQ